MRAAWVKSQHIVSKTVNVLGKYEMSLASYICLCLFVYIEKKLLFVKVNNCLLENFEDCICVDYFPCTCFGLGWPLLFWIAGLDYLYPNK